MVMMVGIHTHTPFTALMDMPIARYIRLEEALVRKIERSQK